MDSVKNIEDCWDSLNQSYASSELPCELVQLLRHAYTSGVAVGLPIEESNIDAALSVLMRMSPDITAP